MQSRLSHGARKFGDRQIGLDVDMLANEAAIQTRAAQAGETSPHLLNDDHDAQVEGMQMNRLWIWQRPGWPEWEYALSAATVDALRELRADRDEVDRMAESVLELAPRAVRGALVREASATSEIEDEHISYDDLRTVVEAPELADEVDPRAAGVVGMLEICRSAPALDRTVLSAMHESLLGYQRGKRVAGPPLQIGAYRKTNVYIHSPARGVIYEAPGPEQVEQLMANFLHWLDRPLVLPMNATPEPLNDQALLAPVKAAVAHLWFERIHPFSDGNGRIGRALAERVLRGPSRGAGYLATAINVRREGYYEELGRYGKDVQGNDMSSWVEWFVHVCRLSLDWEWERIRFEKEREAFMGTAAAGLSATARSALDAILGDWPGGRFAQGVSASEWNELLGGSAAPEDDLDSLAGRGILAEGEPGQYAPFQHFRRVCNRLFEVGVHWIPSSPDQDTR